MDRAKGCHVPEAFEKGGAELGQHDGFDDGAGGRGRGAKGSLHRQAHGVDDRRAAEGPGSEIHLPGL